MRLRSQKHTAEPSSSVAAQPSTTLDRSVHQHQDSNDVSPDGKEKEKTSLRAESLRITTSRNNSDKKSSGVPPSSRTLPIESYSHMHHNGGPSIIPQCSRKSAANGSEDSKSTSASPQNLSRPKRKWKAVPFQPTKRSYRRIEGGQSSVSKEKAKEPQFESHDSSLALPLSKTQSPKSIPQETCLKPSSASPSSQTTTPMPVLRSVPCPPKENGSSVLTKEEGKTSPLVDQIQASPIQASTIQASPIQASPTPPPKYTRSERKSRLRDLLSKSGSIRLSGLHMRSVSNRKNPETQNLHLLSFPSQQTNAPELNTDSRAKNLSEKKQQEEINDAPAPPSAEKPQDESGVECCGPAPIQVQHASKDTSSPPMERDCDVVQANCTSEADLEASQAPKYSSSDELIAPPVPSRRVSVPSTLTLESRENILPNIPNTKPSSEMKDLNDTPRSQDGSGFIAVSKQIITPVIAATDVGETHTQIHAKSQDTSNYPTKASEGSNRDQESSGGVRSSAPLSVPSARKASTDGDECDPSSSEHNSKSSDEKEFVPDVHALANSESDEEIIVRRVKRKTRGGRDISRLARRMTVSKNELQETSILKSTDNKPAANAEHVVAQKGASFPNRYILNDGNTPAFRHRLQSGKKLTVYQWDTFYMSPVRFLSENALIACADLTMRHHNIGPTQGYELIDETLFTAELFRSKKPELSRFALQQQRWESIFDSKVVFLPVFKSNHWSLVALAGCSEVLQVVWTKSFPGNSSPKRPVQVVAAHFDSLSSLGHNENVPNVCMFIEKGIMALWKHKQKSCDDDGLILPDIRAIIKSSLKVVYCDVEQQSDGVSCGWRTIQHMLHVTTTGVKSPNALIQLANTKLVLDFQKSRDLALSLAEKLIRPGNTDIPTITYPLHALVDAAKLSFFQATASDLQEKASVFIRGAAGNNTSDVQSDAVDKAPKNATKKAQANSIGEVSRKVLCEMKAKGLDKKRVMRKEVTIPDKMGLEIAKYLFHYPVGKQYAECLYYTRYSYPDSFLVCLGADLIFTPNPRIFGEFISAPSSRVKRSRSVHYQMDVFKSVSRNATRYYDEVARFRLQEMVEHFRGIAEAVLKSCAKHAMVVVESSSRRAQNQTESTAAQAMEIEEAADNSKSTSSQSDGESSDEDSLNSSTSRDRSEDMSWDFSKSVVFQPPVHNELGHIRSKVSARDISVDLDTCLKAADYVANEAIVSRIALFEKYCRRNMQLQNRTVKVNSVKDRVTGDSLATIPSTFANNFVTLLKKEVREIWGQDMTSDFFDGALDMLLSRLMLAANSIYRRNGQVFLNILRSERVLDITSEKGLESKKKSSPEESSLRKSLDNSRKQDSSGSLTKPATSFNSFGLGLHTELGVGASELRASGVPSLFSELLAFILFVFQGCQSKHVKSLSYVSDEEFNTSSGKESFAQHFSDIRKKRDQAFQELAAVGAQPWWEDGTNTVRHQIKLLKMKIIRRISLKMTNPNVLLVSNSLFCYEVPTSNNEKPNTEQDISCGKSFTVFHGLGQGIEDILWNVKAYEINSCSVLEDEEIIARSGPDALLGDVLLSRRSIPNIKVLSLKGEVCCTADVWNEVDFQVKGDQYLGFRKLDPVKVILSIHNSTGNSSPHPLRSDYHHCFIGLVMDDPTRIGDSAPQRGSTAADIERMRCIGPMKVEFKVALHDNLSTTSGANVSVSSFVERWERTRDSGRSCYIVPVDGISFREEASQYYALMNCRVTPPIFKLALLSLGMAESYELERRKRDYQLMRHVLAEDRFRRHKFISLEKLEHEHREMLRSVVGFFDKTLSNEQYLVIYRAMYGWPSDSSPNGLTVLGYVTDEMKDCLRNSGTVARDDLKWWGSSLCILDGCPGSGKSRTLATLLCSVVQSMAIPSSIYGYRDCPRVLVVTISNSAMEDLFCRVCDILRRTYGQNRSKYRHALKKMVCISSKTTKELVRSRQTSYLTSSGTSESVIQKASIVFATVSDLHDEQICFELPFSLLVVDEAEFLEDESLIEAVSAAFAFYENVEDFQRATILLSGNHTCTGDLDLDSTRTNVFLRALDSSHSCNSIVRASLSHQYRMAPPLVKFISSLGSRRCQGDGENGSGEEGNPRDKVVFVEDENLKSLRRSRDYPIRNIMVIDTSLDKKNAFATSCSNDSWFNKFEANTIRQLLSKWAGDKLVDSTSLQKNVTVICAYSRQRVEISKQLANEGLLRVQVRTLDQVMGIENDIIVISLVNTPSQQLRAHERETKLYPPNTNTFQWMLLACTRARKALVVVGFGKHFCEKYSCWGQFFKACLANTESDPNGVCGYFRPRFITGKEDFKLTPFSPSYASG